mgnify:CR=1 FL=1
MSTLPRQLIKPTEAIEDFVRLAKEYGVHRDQLNRFIKAGYIPLKWQLRFHGVARIADLEDGPTDIGVGGARGPGKSHGVFAQVTLDDCQRVSKLKALFLRQTIKSADESFQDLVDAVLIGRIAHRFNSSKGRLFFPNGSKVILGGFENENDIDKYVGIQYDVIAVEERNQLTGDKILKLKGSLRTVKPNWRARMYSSFNPGNIGHTDVKQTFIEPYQKGIEGKTKFIPSTYKDNVYLKPEYVEYLNSLPGALGKAWREGNFDTFEGQYFSEWDYDRHVVKPFEISVHWKRFRSYDHGYAKPAACGWYALDGDGRVYKYRELYVTGLTVDQIALEVTRLSGDERYDYSVADPSIFANIGYVDKYGGQTIAETFAHNGVQWLPASNRRVDGWNLVHQYLYWDENKKPMLQVFDTCYNTIRTIPSLIHDERKPEDLDTNGDDHVVDNIRYLLMSLHERKSPKVLSETERLFNEMKRSYEPQLNLKEFYGS